MGFLGTRVLRRLGSRPAATFVGDEPFGPDLPVTHLRQRLLEECLKRLVRGDNRDEPDERCWRAFTETLGIDPDRQVPYTAVDFDRPTYAMMVDVFAELSGLADHHEAHAWPMDGETLVAVEAIAAFHRAISEPEIPAGEREQAHVEALVQCLRQWVTEIPLGLAAAVRDLEAPVPSVYGPQG